MYDFRDAENMDGLAEFGNIYGITCKTRNIIEFAKMWMQFIKIRVFRCHIWACFCPLLSVSSVKLEIYSQIQTSQINNS